MRLWPGRFDARQFEANANRQYRRPVMRQCGECAVEKSTAVADAVSRGIEGIDRDQQGIGPFEIESVIMELPVVFRGREKLDARTNRRRQAFPFVGCQRQSTINRLPAQCLPQRDLIGSRAGLCPVFVGTHVLC